MHSLAPSLSPRSLPSGQCAWSWGRGWHCRHPGVSRAPRPPVGAAAPCLKVTFQPMRHLGHRDIPKPLLEAPNNLTMRIQPSRRTSGLSLTHSSTRASTRPCKCSTNKQASHKGAGWFSMETEARMETTPWGLGGLRSPRDLWQTPASTHDAEKLKKHTHRPFPQSGESHFSQPAAAWCASGKLRAFP